jgi:hypothetical protein
MSIPNAAKDRTATGIQTPIAAFDAVDRVPLSGGVGAVDPGSEGAGAETELVDDGLFAFVGAVTKASVERNGVDAGLVRAIVPGC